MTNNFNFSFSSSILCPAFGILLIILGFSFINKPEIEFNYSSSKTQERLEIVLNKNGQSKNHPVLNENPTKKRIISSESSALKLKPYNLYRVDTRRVSLNIRKGPGTNYPIVGKIKRNGNVRVELGYSKRDRIYQEGRIIIGNWKKIHSSDNKANGYIFDFYIRKI